MSDPDDLAPPVAIEDVDDPRIAVFRVVRERDLVGRQGVFIAEGATVLAVLLRAPIERIAILVEEGRIARLPMLAARGSTPLYSAPQIILDRIAGYHLHRGILAAGRVPPSHDLAPAVRAGVARVPILAGLANHDNVGGVYRNAAAFGAQAVIVDATTADPFYRKAIRVGVGAPLLVPTVRTGDAMAAVDLAEGLGFTVYALAPRCDAAIGEVPLAARAAFLLGSEGPGLPQAILARTRALSIPIAPGFDSLNVAAASAIALHTHAHQHGLASS